MSKELLNWPNRVKTLPMTLDRFRATCVFFDVKFPPFLVAHLDAQKWISWGSLSALASIPEVFEREMQTLGLRDLWLSSPSRIEMRSDPLLVILRELRNYETHLTFLSRKRSSEIPKGNVISHVDHHSFFFGPVSFTQLSELRNIREGRSPVTQAAVNDFNLLAESHTAQAIVDLGLDRLSEIIAAFLQSVV